MIFPRYPLGTTFALRVRDTHAPPDLLSAALEIPGVWASNQGFGFLARGSIHAGRILLNLLEREAGGAIAGLTLTVKIPSWATALGYRADGFDAAEVEAAVHARIAASEVRSSTLRTQLHYQRDGVPWAIANGGGHTWWAPGSGKTRQAVVAMLGVPWNPETGEGRVLIVTQGSVRYQYARAIAEAADVVPYVCDPAERGTVGWESPGQYLLRCWEHGARPVIVVGWEELPALVYGEDAYRAERVGGGTEPAELVSGYSFTDDAADGGAEGNVVAGHSVHENGEVDAPPPLTAYAGVGDVLASKLIDAFGGTDAVLAASVEALQAVVPGAKRSAKLRAAFDAGPVGTTAERAGQRRTHARDEMRGFLQGYAFDTLVLDEVQLAKSRERVKWQRPTQDGERPIALSMRNRTAAAAWCADRATFRLATTGSPIADRERDLWGILTLIEPGAWGKSYWRWARRLGIVFTDEASGRTKDEGKGSARGRAELLYRLGLAPLQGGGLGGLLHEPRWRTVDRVPLAVSHAALPPKRRSVRWLTPSTLPAPSRVRLAEVRNAVDTNERRIAELHVECSRKLPAVVDAVLETVEARLNGGLNCPTKGKVVVLTGLRDDVTALVAGIEAALAKQWWRALIPIVGVSGDVAPKARDDVRLRYMASTGPFILVATGYSVGRGLDLHDTDRAVMAMIPPTPETAEQWEQRFFRVGMNRPCEVLWLAVSGTVEEREAYRLMPKLEAAGTLGVSDGARLAGDLRGWSDAEGRATVIANMLAESRVADEARAASSAATGKVNAVAEDWLWAAYGGA